jgi:hypothetical protein
MPQNMRSFVPGGTFFFTVTLLDGVETNDAKGGIRGAFPLRALMPAKQSKNAQHG